MGHPGTREKKSEHAQAAHDLEGFAPFVFPKVNNLVRYALPSPDSDEVVPAVQRPANDDVIATKQHLLHDIITNSEYFEYNVTRLYQKQKQPLPPQN